MGNESRASAPEAEKAEGVKTSFALDSKLLSVAAVSVLFIVALFLWTLPFQQNRLPFGEGDSAWHFSIGDDIAFKDSATFRLPYYVGIWYYNWNKILGPFALEYPPSNHVNYALMQVFGGERFVPVFIYRAIASFLGVFAVYFLLSRLYGTLPAFLAGLGLVFSFREQMIYLWGQQPTLVALVIVPAVLYSLYSYLNFFYSGEEKRARAYLYVASALLASQFMLHIQGLLASLLIGGIFTAMMAAKFRKLPFAGRNLVHLAASLTILLVVALPFVLVYVGAPLGSPSVPVGRLFQWNVPHSLVSGSFPEIFVLFSSEYPSFVQLFLFAGIALLIVRALLVRPNSRELLLISWLVGLYVIFHLDVFKILDPGRAARMQVMEPALFFSLAALSVVWAPSMISSIIKVRSPVFSAAKYVLAAVLVFALVATSGNATYRSLKDAYAGIARITPVQAEFAEWVGAALPEKAYVFDPSVEIVGQWRYPKTRWMLGISRRHVGNFGLNQLANPIYGYVDKNDTYIFFDYSDIALLASSQQYQQQAIAWASRLQQVEVGLFNNTAPLYDKNSIRLYKLKLEGEVSGG